MNSSRVACGLVAGALALAFTAGCAASTPAPTSLVAHWAEASAVPIPEDTTGAGADLAVIADAIADKTPYLEAATAVGHLVASIEDGADRETALHSARQIHAWYEGFSLPWEEIPAYRDERAAESVRWWQEQTATRTVYWAASAHVANAPDLTITEPEAPDTVLASAGSYLRDWYGDRYVAIGFTFDHGTYRTEEGEVIKLPPAPAGWFEQPLADVTAEQFVLVLDGEVPPAADQWLDADLVTRGRPEHGEASAASGGTLREWFDVLVHTQEVTPARPM